jgi:hypothetical protein
MTPPTGPPESIDEPPIDADVAARLMADVGFVAFRTLSGSRVPQSCLMVTLHDIPTERHFDTEVISYWVTSVDRGQLQTIDTTTRLPFSHPFSWGRIRLVDRFNARNSFVSFGGALSGESVGTGARLFIFRSPAPIFRLPGHSQREDRLAGEVMTFFGRIMPHLWTPETERRISSASPLDVYAAFLLHARARLARSRALRDALGGVASSLHKEVAVIEENDRDRLEAGQRLLAALEIPPATG